MIKRTIYCGSPAYLSVQNEQLLIKPRGENAETFSIPIEDIGYLELDNHQITLSATLLTKMAQENCAISVCDNSHIPIGLYIPISGHSIHTERMKPQLSAKVPLNKRLWQQTVKQKIRNQAAVLQKFGKPYITLKQKEEAVQSGDSTNQEGIAAGYYWKTLFGKSFKREREGEMPNALLNYGYAILRAILARAIVGTGLLPSLGIHHKNRYNSYCLADDLMEPYRPFVDALVFTYFRDNEGLMMVDKNAKKHLLQIPVLDVGWEKETRPLMNAAQLTASSLWKCYNNEVKNIAYPDFL